MSAWVHIEADCMQNGLSGSGHLVRIQSLFTEQSIDRSGGDRGQELAIGVRPFIRRARLQEHRTRRDQCDEQVRIDGGFVDLVRPLRIIGAELIRVRRLSAAPPSPEQLAITNAMRVS
jgi:hypothetical protein